MHLSNSKDYWVFRSSWPIVGILQASHKKLSWANWKIYLIFLYTNLSCILVYKKVTATRQDSAGTYIGRLSEDQSEQQSHSFLNIGSDDCLQYMSLMHFTRLNNFLVENNLSYMYNIKFSALRVMCFKNVCEFVY